MNNHRLTIRTTTTVADLVNLTDKMGHMDKLRVKKDHEGNSVLYFSDKQGTGLKNFLFGTVDKRRADTRTAVAQILGPNGATLIPAFFSGDLGRPKFAPLDNLPQVRQAKVAEHKLKILASLPKGVQISDQGDLSGKATFAYVPSNFKKDPNQAGTPIESGFQKGCQEALAPDKLVQIGTHWLPSQANSDFFRLAVKVGSYDSLVNASTVLGEGERNAQVADAVCAVAGDDNTAKVLASVMTQLPLQALLLYLPDAEGRCAEHLRVLSALNTARRVMTLRGIDGMDTELEVKGMGGARWVVSKESNGDLRLAVDWPVYLVAKEGHEDHLPLHANGAIKMHLSFDIVIDGAQAREGTVALSVPGGITAEFSGQVDFRP